MNRNTAWPASTILIIFSFAAALILGEFFLRIFYPQRLYYNISQWDPDTGFTLIPGIVSEQIHPEYRMQIQINSRGLREREYTIEKPLTVLRVGIFGDSFTFGEGVNANETFPKVLEKLLNKDLTIRNSGCGVEVLNFGIGKTGTSHQLAWYLKEGVLYDLDIVVLAFLAANDFGDNLRGVYKIHNGELVHDAASYSSIRKIQAVVYKIPGYRWLAEHSHLVNLARVVTTSLNDRSRTVQAGINSEDLSDRNMRQESAKELTLRLVEEFKSEAESRQSHFLMTSLPARGQRPLAEYANPENAKPYIHQLDFLQTEIETHDIPYLDLVPVFASLDAGPPYYYVDDGHMQPAGLAVIAEHLNITLLPSVRESIIQRNACQPSPGTE